jgi:DNA repair exonuclease SbcCD ATPase subunit
VYQQFTDKIQALEAEISQIDERLQANSQDIEQQKSNVKQLEFKLLQARKVYALDDSLDNRKAVSEIQKEVTKAKADLDDLQILQQALEDKKAGLENELKRTTEALRQAELECMIDKAPGLIDEYDKLIRQAYKIACRLRVLHRETEQRNKLEYLKKICRAASNLAFLPVTFFTSKLDPHSQGPIGPSCTRNEQELTGEYHHEKILEELLS